MPYFLDGNNLIGVSAEEARREPGRRRAFLLLLSRYASTRGGRIRVYFDGDDPVGGVAPRGVQVCYSAPLSSDDAILRDIEGSRFPSEVIVVTNDRSLSARCRDAGARVMSWSEFTGLAEKQAGPPRTRTDREEKVDVKEWSRYFGFDPDSLD